MKLVLSIDGVDVSKTLVWQRYDNWDDGETGFVGVDSLSGIRIQRYYRRNPGSNSVRHDIEIDLSDVASPSEISLQLKVSGSLMRHIPNDDSLGDYFYGYQRSFAQSSENSAVPYRVMGDDNSKWAALVTRHSGLILQNSDSGQEANIVFRRSDPVEVTIESLIPNREQEKAQRRPEFSVDLKLVPLTSSSTARLGLTELIYSDAWLPFRYLSLGIDRVLEQFGELFGSMGIAVLIFAVLVRAILSPISFWSIKRQREFSETQIAMRPRLAVIEETCRGEEKSERTLELYKEHGISPFSGLKGSVSLFVQIPILISLFNVTAESAIFREAPFLWLSDLSLPDQLAQLPVPIPMLGSSLNLLPLALGAITLLIGYAEARQETSAASPNKTAILFTAIIIVFFYSCSAALVIYWITINILQFFERRFVGKSWH